MRRVIGHVSCRAFGRYDFDFYVNDNTSDEEIKKEVDEMTAPFVHYEIEDGYEECTKVYYRKADPFEYC